MSALRERRRAEAEPIDDVPCTNGSVLRVAQLEETGVQNLSRPMT